MVSVLLPSLVLMVCLFDCLSVWLLVFFMFGVILVFLLGDFYFVLVMVMKRIVRMMIMESLLLMVRIFLCGHVAKDYDGRYRVRLTPTTATLPVAQH